MILLFSSFVDKERRYIFMESYVDSCGFVNQTTIWRPMEDILHKPNDENSIQLQTLLVLLYYSRDVWQRKADGGTDVTYATKSGPEATEDQGIIFPYL